MSKHKDNNNGSQLENWLYFFKNEGKSERDESMSRLLDENPFIKKAHEKYISFIKNEELVRAYEERMKLKQDYYSCIESIKAEGQQVNQRAIAKKMLQKGYKIEDISEFTGVDILELKKV
ncbi:MAG: PD-(D/E)XK nuclease family transposase [Bacteroidota bacterium]